MYDSVFYTLVYKWGVKIKKKSFSNYKHRIKLKQKRFYEKIEALMLEKTGKVKKRYSKKKYISKIIFNIFNDW